MIDDIPEEWRPVPGFEGRYDVSYLGHVRSLPRKHGRPRVLVASPDGSGYLQVCLCKDGRQYMRKVHLLVLTAFTSPRPEGMQGRHLNGDQRDNARTNLMWGTVAENTLDQVRHGTHVQARKGKCRHGHAYTEANTYVSPSGRRLCRECRRAERLARAA